MCFLSYFRTLLVTDDWVQSGNDTDTVLYHFVATLFVYGDTEDALRSQGFDGVLQPCQTLEEAFCDDWFHYVQLQLASLCCKADCSIVTYYLEANLIGYLWNNWVNLTWHDRRTWSLRRKVDFV